MKKNKYLPILIAITGMLLLAACSGGNASPANAGNTSPDTLTTIPPDGQLTDIPGIEPTEEPEPVDPNFTALPAEPQQITITTSDGRVLEGMYYPAKVPNARVLVLMHWAGGDINDWNVIAPWLQNRQDELGLTLGWQDSPASYNLQVIGPWLDPTWFPPLAENDSYAVVSFSFGGFGRSEGGHNSWVEDATAAIRFAASLEGVNKDAIAALGASIGADGAVDGCYMFNAEDTEGTCLGALSLSPGNYLTNEFTYAEAVTALDTAGYPVWCLAAEGDYESPATCQSGQGTLYQVYIYENDPHGMFLIDPALQPIEPAMDANTLQLLLQWLEEVFADL